MDIILTKLQTEDIELVRSWRNSEEVASYMYTSETITEEQQRNWWNAALHMDRTQHSFVTFRVELKHWRCPFRDANHRGNL